MRNRASAVAGSKRAPRSRRSSSGQHASKFLEQPAPARGEFVAAGRPNEKFVMESLAQPLQHSAHGRLAQVMSLCRARDAALLQQGQKRGQQIEVRFTNML